jgi:hypothetical protein
MWDQLLSESIGEEGMSALGRAAARVSESVVSGARCLVVSECDQIENAACIFNPTTSTYAPVLPWMANARVDLTSALEETDSLRLVSSLRRRGARLWLRDKNACGRLHHVCSERVGGQRLDDKNFTRG